MTRSPQTANRRKNHERPFSPLEIHSIMCPPTERQPRTWTEGDGLTGVMVFVIGISGFTEIEDNRRC